VSDERWERVKAILHQALQLTADQRSRFLSEACSADDPLRSEVESLLAADANARSSFLQGAAQPDGPKPPDGLESLGTLAEGQIFEQRFRLLHQIGQGGMGQVWLCEQLAPVRREVALKLIRAGMFDDTVVQRFRAERQSLASMDHPYIAKVFEAGASALGQPYLVMEYAPGLPITEYCDLKQLSIRQRLELFIKACEGVQHAHHKAVIHRDLKPANILVVEVDGVPTPRIIDFGLAKPVAPASAEQALYTRLGVLVGTPAFMSPEQADPSVTRDVDTRADVYSLGVILYVLLTGRRPFENRQQKIQPFDEWLRQLRTSDPPRLTAILNGDASAAAAARATHPGQLARQLRGDLEWIASKAVWRERESRYASPAELAEDLRRYLRHEPVSARPASALYQVRRFMRRHRVVAGVAALISVSAIVAVIAAVLAVRGQREAEYQQRQAQYQTQQALQAQGHLLTEVAAERLTRGDVANAQRLILAVITDPRLQQGRAPAAISVFQESRASDNGLAVLSGHADRVLAARYAPDGTRIVTASADKTARVWDALTGAQLMVMAGHTDRVFDASYSPNGARIITGSNDRTARVWDARNGAPLLTLSGHTARVNSARYAPDGRRLLTASWDKTARIWDATTGARLLTLVGHTDVLYTAEYAGDGQHIVTASQDKTARVWDARTGAQVAVLRGHGDYVACAAYSPDGTRIVTASADKTARVWDAHSGAPLAVLSGHGDVVYSAVFSPDGRRILTASWDKTARIWDGSSGRQLAMLSGHAATLASAAYSPDGLHIVTASQDRTARTWDARIGGQLSVLSGHRDVVNSAEYSADGERIVSSSSDGTARTWDASTGRQLLVLSGHSGAVDFATFSRSDRRILTASQDETARIWDADSGSALIMLSGHIDRVYAGAFSPDDTRVVTASRDKTARIWDADSGTSLAVLSGHRDRVYFGSWSRDGRQIVTASRDRTARVWDGGTGATRLVLTGHDDQVLTAHYSPDNRRIVTASTDGTARIWDARSGAQLAVLLGHGNGLTSAQYSPDGAHIVTASEDRTARVWEAGSGEQLAVLAGHTGGVTSAAYSPDGKHIVTGSEDQTVRVWDARPSGDLATQVLWSEAAEIDPLSASDRVRLGLPADPGVRKWASEGTACDLAAAAPYDPERVAPGVSAEDIDASAAGSACAVQVSSAHHALRFDYEMGRALMAKGDVNAATGELEAAVSGGYGAAQIDLGDLLLRESAAQADMDRARALYEKAWRGGILIGAFALGQMYERLTNQVEAQSWYRKGADAGEPTALAHLAERQERSALNATEPVRLVQLLQAFSLYAAAAKRARLQGWSDDSSRHWRHRRASLAHVLAAEGLQQQVAESFRRYSNAER
jgi:WD40 repeat protein/serine/threonine protein kinase